MGNVDLTQTHECGNWDTIRFLGIHKFKFLSSARPLQDSKFPNMWSEKANTGYDYIQIPVVFDR